MDNLFITILVFWLIFGGAIGLPYITLVVSAFFIIKASRQYLVNYFQLAALIAPIAFYLILTHAVNDRQGFNWGYVNLIVALPAIFTLYLGTISPIVYWIGVLITMTTAYLAWLFFPMQGMTKLF